ncbi:hypothetical protein BGZ94_007217 [Podila epigama]|nr:hypothetical protein BGZ94_007217 [Podila epigama]
MGKSILNGYSKTLSDAMKPHYTREAATNGLWVVPPTLSLKSKTNTRQQQQQKRRQNRERPWTNSEQESLYVAVERLKLFGQWEKVKVHMNLDRTVTEIENEYMRLYGEITDTDDECMGGEDDLEGIDEDEDVDVDVDDDEEEEGEDVDDLQSTPPLTAASSCAPSARSSQESISTLYAGSQSAHRSSLHQHHRASSSIDISSFHIRDRLEDYDYHEGGDIEPSNDTVGSSHSNNNNNAAFTTRNTANNNDNNNTKTARRPRKPSSTSSSPPLPNNAQLPTMSATVSTTAADSTRPAPASRMVRVWTVEQSENLKNLIEVYFPGSYRINWVWVAAQMGNAFTRKQCKNKWEIMRRRMGTDEEISLLKKGYSEFGPSWGQIQEKYLPERSRGGISIMWELLEGRELERKNGEGDNTGNSSTSASHPRASLSSSSATTVNGSRHGRTGSTLSAASNGNALSRINAPKPKNDFQHSRRTSSMTHVEVLETMTPMYSRQQTDSEMRYHPYAHRYENCNPSLTESTRQARPPHHFDHPNQQQSHDSSGYSYLTESLKRRLEYLVQQQMSSQQHINWVEITSAMAEATGSAEAPTMEQCQQWWCHISQQNPMDTNVTQEKNGTSTWAHQTQQQQQQQHHHHHKQDPQEPQQRQQEHSYTTSVDHFVGHPRNDMRMDVEHSYN